MEEAVDADRVIVMEKGKKLLEGTPREVFSKVDTIKKYRIRCSLYDRIMLMNLKKKD